jgi:hypothetical protein
MEQNDYNFALESRIDEIGKEMDQIRAAETMLEMIMIDEAIAREDDQADDELIAQLVSLDFNEPQFNKPNNTNRVTPKPVPIIRDTTSYTKEIEDKISVGMNHVLDKHVEMVSELIARMVVIQSATKIDNFWISTTAYGYDITYELNRFTCLSSKSDELVSYANKFGFLLKVSTSLQVKKLTSLLVLRLTSIECNPLK